jgi:hypothetical protein
MSSKIYYDPSIIYFQKKGIVGTEIWKIKKIGFVRGAYMFI